MLAPAPYQMPVKEGKAERTKDGPHPEGVPDKIPSSKDKNDWEVNVSSPHGKKRAASEDWEKQAPKQGKMPQVGDSGLEDVEAQSHDEDKPQAKS